MAVRDYIKIVKDSNAAERARDIIAFRNAVATVLSLGPPMLLIMNHNFDDANPQAIVWTDLETLFGVPSGKGQTIFDMVNGIMGALTGTMQNDQAVQMESRVG